MDHVIQRPIAGYTDVFLSSFLYSSVPFSHHRPHRFPHYMRVVMDCVTSRISVQLPVRHIIDAEEIVAGRRLPVIVRRGWRRSYSLEYGQWTASRSDDGRIGWWGHLPRDDVSWVTRWLIHQFIAAVVSPTSPFSSRELPIQINAPTNKNY